MFGLDTDTLRNIKACFAQIPAIEKVIIYGSRAKGNYRTGSDIDITLLGKNLSLKNSVYPLNDLLEELYLPYKFDISIFAKLDNPDFISHILRVGKTLYLIDKEIVINDKSANNSQLTTNNYKKGWAYGILDDVVNKGSSNISLNKIKDDDGDYLVFKAKGFAQNVSFFHREKEYLAIIKDGAGIGRVSKHPAKSSVVATMQYLIPKEGFDIGFVGYFLNGIDFEKHRNGSTIPHIYFKDYKSEAFPLIPLPEQQRIVAILDKALGSIEKAKLNIETNLQNTKELFESYLQNIFENKGDDWEGKTLEQISDVFGRGKSKHRPRNDKKLFGGDYPFIQTGDIRNSEHFVTNYSQTYNEIGLAQSKLWPKGTICITIAANIAETGVLSFDACFPDSVIGIVVNKKLADIDFVEYLLQSFKVNLQALSKGSAQDNINLGTFKNKLFPFPPIKEQQEIVKKLNNLSAETKKIEIAYSQKLTNLEKLKKSILERAFNGELV